MNITMFLGLAIFLVVYILIALDVLNKAIAVLAGGVIFIALGFINQEKAFLSIDWNVIFLLISMMIIIGITKHTGLFQFIAIKAAKIAKGEPIIILLLLSLITAVFSAFLDNVTTVLILTPVCILIAVELGISPVPFVISIAVASNIGGTATLIGDPPNIMIGSAAKLDFNDFLFTLTPIVLVILVIFTILFYFIFRKKLVVTLERKARIMDFDENKTLENIPLLIKSVVVLCIVIVGFLVHSILNLEPATISLLGASLLMVIAGRKNVHDFFNEIEWETIFFFIGLFIIVGGLVELGIIKVLAKWLFTITKGDIKVTSISMIWFSGIFSSFVDNIPYVATMIPLIQDIATNVGNEAVLPLWWSLSLGACLGGNGTLIGASANVVSAGLSAKSGHKISFIEFTKYGILITFFSLLASTLYIYMRFLTKL